MLLSPPLAHPDADNGPSVSQCLLWRAVHLCALHRTTFKPLSLFLRRLVSPTALLVSPSLFFWLSWCFFIFSFVSLPLHALFPFSLFSSQFGCSFADPSTASLSYPWEQFTSAWPNRFPPYMSVMESSPSPPLSSVPSFTSPSSSALSLPPLLLTFCLPTHFKFN